MLFDYVFEVKYLLSPRILGLISSILGLRWKVAHVLSIGVALDEAKVDVKPLNELPMHY